MALYANRAEALLITDLDNTLYDFPAYYQAGLRGMIAELHDTLNLDAVSAAGRLRVVYARHCSIEHPFAVEEIPEIESLDQPAKRELVRRAVAAFWRSASTELRLYPSVRETLRELRRQGIPVVAYTDAPIHEAMRRLRCLQVDSYIVGIVAQQWFRRRPRKTFAMYLRDLPGFTAPSRKHKILWRLPEHDRKPSVSVYSRIQAAFDLEPSQVTVVGDSFARDLAPAIEIGISAIWAQYGHRDGNLAQEKLLQLVVPSRLPEVGSPRTTPQSSAVQITRFCQVMEALPVQQMLWYD